jgi:hypothetical protein
VPDSDCPPLADRITKSLLGYGIIAGPCYVIVAVAQILCRDGYDWPTATSGGSRPPTSCSPER